jgi:hypothetical protein
VDEWLKIYRKYTDAELTAEITWLKTQIRNPFNAQTEGNRSYSRSTAEFRDRLSAALEVQAERSNSTPRHGVADFSGVRFS